MQRQKLLITSLFFMAVLPVLAGNIAFAQIWNGNVSSEWNNPSNWDGGVVPGTSSSVVITNGTFKPVVNSSVTVGSLQIGSWYPRSGEAYIDVVNGGSLVVTDELSFISDGYLLINGGDVELTYTSETVTGNNQNYIEMSSGSFTTNGNLEVNTNNPGFLIGDGTAVINGDLLVNSGKIVEIDNGALEVKGFLWIESSAKFYNNSGTVNVLGEEGYDPDIEKTEIIGSYYGGDGVSNFYDETNVGSGGRIYLDDGIINFQGYTFIGSNGEAHFGSGTVNFTADSEIASGGYMFINDATVNVTGDVVFQGNGNLEINSGSLNVGGDADMHAGGTMNLNNGNLNIQGNAEFTGGSTINAGGSTITLEGDITVHTDNFNADTSTVIFSGGSDQSVNVQTNSYDITFYDVVVDSGTVFQTDGSDNDDTHQNTIIIENDLTVNEGASVIVNDDDQIDIQGSLDDESESVVIDRPYIRHMTTPDLNTIVIEFDKDMETGPIETVSNYSINNGVTVTNAVQDPNNARFVTLTVSTLIEDEEYELIADNLFGTNGFQMLNGHIKRLSADTIVSFYSRKNGEWDSNSAWSTEHIGGSAASQNPSNTTNATILIDSTHIITITSDATITNQASVTVNGNGTLKLASSGSLEFGDDIITGTGTFEVTSGTLKIGAADGISTSGPTGNIQTATRIFGSDASYIYNGHTHQQTGTGLPTLSANVEIDNFANVRLTNNLEVTGTLSLNQGSLIIPSGKNLIANNKSIASGDLIMEHQITGQRGWRQLSSPLSSTYGDLLDSTITQGYPGAFYSTGTLPGDTLQPNVLFYDETYAVNENGGPATDNQRWRAPVNAASTIPEAQGIYAFFFGQIAEDPLYNSGNFDLPVTLSVKGQENEGDGELVDFNVSFTAEADSGWNLVGNPYAATIDWDNHTEWVKTNIDNTIYIWDNASKNYKTWNGVTGDLEDGLISPFQGFWVKANDEDPVLQIKETAKTFGGTYVGKRIANPKETPQISLTLSDGESSISTHLMFTEEAKIGKDHYDAYRLAPPPEITSFVDMVTLSNSGQPLIINNLPRKFGRPYEVPLYVDVYEDGFSAGKELTLSWDESNLPAGWSITIVDNQSRAKHNLHKSTSYTFLNSGSKKIAPNFSTNRQEKSQRPRFLLIINPGDDAADLPSEYTLEQNYPNPFNPTTNIQFSLPFQSQVELTIFDMLGRKVATLVQDELLAGTHTFEWRAGNLASGIYLYRLVTSEAVVTKKMTLIK